MPELLKTIIFSILFYLSIIALIAHIFVMPVFLSRLKKHDKKVHSSVNVAWFYIFYGMNSTIMMYFLFKNEFLDYPEDLHKLGKILKYTWAYPLTFITASIVIATIVFSIKHWLLNAD